MTVIHGGSKLLTSAYPDKYRDDVERKCRQRGISFVFNGRVGRYPECSEIKSSTGAVPFWVSWGTWIVLYTASCCAQRYPVIGRLYCRSPRLLGYMRSYTMIGIYLVAPPLCTLGSEMHCAPLRTDFQAQRHLPLKFAP